MNHLNPFVLFTSNELNVNSVDALMAFKEWKVDFSSQQRTTTSSWTPEQVESMFAQLQLNKLTYQAIFENKVLLDFFANGNTDFFKNENAVAQSRSNMYQKEKIEHIIANTLNEKLSKVITTPTIQSKTTFELIHKYAQNLSPDNQRIIYIKSFQVLEQFVDNLKVEFPTPFEGVKGFKFHNKIRLYVDLLYLNFYDFLPSNFESLKVNHAQWIRNHVLASLNVVMISRFKQRDLSTTRLAAKSVLRDLISPEETKSANAILGMTTKFATASSAPNGVGGSDSRTGHRKKSSSSGGTVIGVIIGLFVIISAVSRFVRVSNELSNKKQQTYEPYSLPQRPYSPSTTYPIPSRNNDVYVHPNNAAERKEFTKKEGAFFNGENIAQIGAVHNKTSKSRIFDDNVIFNVRVIPTSVDALEKIIRKESSKERQKPINSDLLIFEHDILNVSFAHRIKKDQSEYGSITAYGLRNSEPDQSDKLITKKLPYKNYNLKGVRTRSTLGTDVRSRSTFHIKYDDELNQFVIEGNDHEKVVISLSEVQATTEAVKSTMPDEKALYLALLKNLEIVNRKQLSRGYAYTLKKVYTNAFPSSSPTALAYLNLDIEKAYLKYYLFSSADNTCYINLNGIDFNGKYFYDKKSGYVRGMQFVKFSKDAREVERIEVFQIDE